MGLLDSGHLKIYVRNLPILKGHVKVCLEKNGTYSPLVNAEDAAVEYGSFVIGGSGKS